MQQQRVTRPAACYDSRQVHISMGTSLLSKPGSASCTRLQAPSQAWVLWQHSNSTNTILPNSAPRRTVYSGFHGTAANKSSLVGQQPFVCQLSCHTRNTTSAGNMQPTGHCPLLDPARPACILPNTYKVTQACNKTILLQPQPSQQQPTPASAPWELQDVWQRRSTNNTGL